jgi:hypothetical protein
MKTFELHVSIMSTFVLLTCKLIVRGRVLKTLKGIKPSFKQSVFTWKRLGNFSYHLKTLSPNKESRWRRTVRLDTLIYWYYFYLVPALLSYQFGIYKPSICNFKEPESSILRWQPLVNSRLPGTDNPIHITSKSLLEPLILYSSLLLGLTFRFIAEHCFVLRTSHFSHSCYMFRSSDCLRIDHQNIIWFKVHTVKFLIMQPFSSLLSLPLPYVQK